MLEMEEKFFDKLSKISCDIYNSISVLNDFCEYNRDCSEGLWNISPIVANLKMKSSEMYCDFSNIRREHNRINGNYTITPDD